MRNVGLNRDEAELLVDLLMLTDHHYARELSAEIRKEFGMVSEDRELEARGMTMRGVRIREAHRLLEENT